MSNEVQYYTPALLAQKVRELARRHVDEDQQVLLEAARRLEIKPPQQFNYEAFSTD